MHAEGQYHDDKLSYVISEHKLPSIRTDVCRQIAAQTNTMMLAGYETTANTLAFSVYLLGKHPQAQQCLLQEIDQFQGRPGYDSLASFPYAAAVINEALRLYPPATFLERVATEDVQVRNTPTEFAASLTGCYHSSCILY